MTHDIERLLASTMREEVTGLLPAHDIVARAARRNRRRARARVAAAVTGTAGIAAAVAIGLMVATSGPGTGHPGPSPVRPGGQVAGPPRSPQARLVAAMTTSAQLSYRLHLVNTLDSSAGQMYAQAHPNLPVNPVDHLPHAISEYANYTGVYDPKSRLGVGVDTIHNDGQVYLRLAVRLVGDNYYLAMGNHGWVGRKGALVDALLLNGGRDWGPANGSSADPAVLLAAARHLGSVKFLGKSGAGAQAVDTYSYSYLIPGDGSTLPHALTGTIVVHDRSNLVAEITMRTDLTGTAAAQKIADPGVYLFSTVMTFSDYGVPVSVTAPPGVVIAQPHCVSMPPPPGAKGSRPTRFCAR